MKRVAVGFSFNAPEGEWVTTIFLCKLSMALNIRLMTLVGEDTHRGDYHFYGKITEFSTGSKLLGWVTQTVCGELPLQNNLNTPIL